MEAKQAELGLACKCGGTRWRVIYVRPIAGGIERRRECRKCGARATSREYFAVPNITHDNAKTVTVQQPSY